MLRLDGTSLKRKLDGLAMIASSLGLLLPALLMGSYDFIDRRKSLARQLTILTHLAAQDTAAAVAFDDREFVTQTLQALTMDDQIINAAVFDASGKLFA